MVDAGEQASWSDLEALGEGDDAEIIGGRLHRLVQRPAPAACFTKAALCHALAGPFGLVAGSVPGGWWILPETDVELGPHDVVSPDLVGWRRERVPEFPHRRPIAERPDWVCEILSPSSLRLDRVLKADLYLRAGIPHYWMVDPEARLVEVFAADGGRWVRLGAHAGEAPARLPPFDAAEIVVETLFPPPPADAEA